MQKQASETVDLLWGFMQLFSIALQKVWCKT